MEILMIYGSVQMKDIQEPMAISALIVFAIAFVFVVIPILTKSSQTKKDVLGEAEQGNPKTYGAQIVSKKTYTPYGSIEQYNFVIFEKDNGERIELAIKNNDEYKLLLEGDHGILTHIGKRYISFERV